MATNSFMDDPQSLAALVDRMVEPERSEYRSYGSLALESAFPGRKMVVYTLRGGAPLDIEIITFGALISNWDEGPSFEVTDSRGKMQVLTTPKRYRPRDVFFQVPQNFVLKYKGRQGPGGDVEFASHYAALVKTRSREGHQVEGHTYCVTLNKYHERFPDLKIRY